MVERVLIAGCGDVGNALAELLLADGCEVWGIRRNLDALAEGVRPWRVDLTDPHSMVDPPAAFDILHYTASADRRDEASYRAIYVDGLVDLLAAVARAGSSLKRVLFTSSTAVYGQARGQWVDESSETEPARFNGRVLLDAEAAVRRLNIGTVVRLSGIYGPGRTRLVRKVWSGEATATPSWTNRIHVQDCGRLLHHLMRLDAPADLYLGSDDAPATTAEVVAWMSQALGVATPGADEARSLNKRCRNTRLHDSGFRFVYPTFRDGYAPIIDRFLEEESGPR